MLRVHLRVEGWEWLGYDMAAAPLREFVAESQSIEPAYGSVQWADS